MNYFISYLLNLFIFIFILAFCSYCTCCFQVNSISDYSIRSGVTRVCAVTDGVTLFTSEVMSFFTHRPKTWWFFTVTTPSPPFQLIVCPVFL